MVEAFLDTTEAMIRPGGFDLLAHPDVVKKNNLSSKVFSEEAAYYQKKTAAIAALLAAAGIPAEVNTGGLNRRKTADCYPSAAFLKLLQKNGVPMVINADAHSAQDVDGYYAEARRAMLDCGVHRNGTFCGEAKRPRCVEYGKTVIELRQAV
jgi:histidinol-phosphatase (PHP family)